MAITLTSYLVDESKRKQEDRNGGDLGDNLGHLKVRDSLSPDIVGETGLCKRGMFGLDGLIKAAAAFFAILLNPFL